MTKPGTYKFETLNTAGGVCCGNDNPDFPRCPRCVGKAVAPRTASLRTAVPKQTVVRKTPSDWRDHFGELLRGYGSLQPESPADPYAPATGKAPTPHDDPNYQPFGTPPDAYSLGLRKGNRR